MLKILLNNNGKNIFLPLKLRLWENLILMSHTLYKSVGRGAYKQKRIGRYLRVKGRKRDYHGKGKVQTSTRPLHVSQYCPGPQEKEQWIARRGWEREMATWLGQLGLHFLSSHYSQPSTKKFRVGPGNHVVEIDRILGLVQKQ